MGHQSFDSDKLAVPAVRGVNTSTPVGAPPECVGVAGQSDLGVAVAGHSISGFGVHGFSQTNFGVRAVSMGGVGLRASTDSGGGAIEAIAAQSGFGVFGSSDTGVGVQGSSRTNHAVHGESNAGRGVVGVSNTFVGVTGLSTSSDGVFGGSGTGVGVHGKGGTGHSGVFGESSDGPGVSGQSATSVGVDARSDGGQAALRAVGTGATVGALGQSTNGVGVFGASVTNDGVRATSTSGNGLSASSELGTGIFATGFVNAGFFQGNVAVTGDITLTGGDCAEDFDLAGSEEVDPGTVMVMNGEGALREGWFAYDNCVAGVVCGGGDYRPGIILDRRETDGRRVPLALLGKVACKVDAAYGSIEVGDLLTTSLTLGHAMKATDRDKAFGSVIGKALRPQREGRGLIPVLVSLQ